MTQRLRLSFFALALLLGMAPSCSDIATKPRAEVQVSGVVETRDGSPMAGATVGFFEPISAPVPVPPPPHFSAARKTARVADVPIATTDAQGRYSISLPASTYEVWIGGVADSGFLPLHVTDVTLRPPVTILPLRYSGYRITGTVRGPGAAPLAAGSLLASSEYTSTRSEIVGGRYTFLLPRGTYRFSVDPQPAGTGVPRIDFPGIEVVSDSTIDFSVDGNLVSGTVLGPGGLPLEAAWVTANGVNASAASQTAADGTYRLYLPSRDYSFYVDPGRGYIATRTLGPTLVTGALTLDFDVSGVEWSGTVRNATTGEPLPQIDVRAFGRKLLGGSYASWTTGADGLFRLVLERNTTYDLAVTPLDLHGPYVVFRSVPTVNDSTFDILLQPPAP